MGKRETRASHRNESITSQREHCHQIIESNKIIMIHWPRKLIYAGAILFSTLAVKVFAFSNPRCSSFVQLVNTRRTLSTTLSPKHQHHVTSTVTTLAMLPPNIPSWAPYSLFHIVGGTTGTPIVVRATKSWYKRIPLPSWTPPNFVFGPVWTLLYGLMGVSVSRIVKASTANSNALNLWKVHYILNLLWAPLFFGFQYLRVGLFINVALVLSLIHI